MESTMKRQHISEGLKDEGVDFANMWWGQSHQEELVSSTKGPAVTAHTECQLRGQCVREETEKASDIWVEKQNDLT